MFNLYTYILMYSGTAHTSHTHVYTYRLLLPVGFYTGLLHCYFSLSLTVAIAKRLLLTVYCASAVHWTSGSSRDAFYHTTNVKGLSQNNVETQHPFSSHSPMKGLLSQLPPHPFLQINERLVACAHLCRSRSIVLRITSDPGKLHYFKEVHVTTLSLLFYYPIVSFSFTQQLLWRCAHYSWKQRNYRTNRSTAFYQIGERTTACSIWLDVWIFNVSRTFICPNFQSSKFTEGTISRKIKSLAF